MPWVNTIAADSNGNALLRRHLGRPERDQREGGRLQHGARARRPSRRSACRCSTARARRASGAPTPTRSSPASSVPATCRSCSATTTSTNSNDSYWLSNPEQPLEGFDRIIGDERTERSLRTRSGLVHGRAAARPAPTAGPATATRSSSCRTRCSTNRQYAGELWRDELADVLRGQPDDDRLERARST